MKKKRVGLLAKIILLTGLLTVLTVSTSLVVGTLALRANAREIYISGCQGETDYIESVFFPHDQIKSAELEPTTKQTLTLLIEEYEKVSKDYSQKSEEQKKEYQGDVRISLFDPEPGSMGMSYDKTMRKNYYLNAANSILSLCQTFKISSVYIDLYDVENGCLVNFFNSNLDVDGNLDNVGLVTKAPVENELDFYIDSNSGFNYKTVTAGDLVHTYNYVDIASFNSRYKCFVKADFSLEETNESFKQQLITELIITVASATLLVIVYAIFTKLFLVRNVERLTTSTNKFVNMMKNDEHLEIVENNVKTTDEIRELSDAFTVMQDQIITYVDNIKKAKLIEQAFNTEVEVASKIQLESLPAPTHFDRNIELRAFIKPAKGVGGDFYDYFYVDDNHLAVVIADVSGKGIPASLFMMRSKESIRSACMNEKDLAKVLFKVNNSLCVNNKEGFFVTIFLGVLDLKTNEFNCISAGHERPFIKHGKECRRLEIESNFVLGLEEDFEYKPQKVKLQEGDAIVLYTDGLNEAINEKKEEFGYDRILKALQKNDDLKINIETAVSDLEKFRGEEDQFDDITILTFKLKKDVISYSYLNPKYEDILDLTAKVEDYLEGLDPVILSKMGVIIDEVMNNIISYGKTKTNKALTITIEKTDGGANLIFVDNSHPFNPLLKKERTIPENMERGVVGGVGISIVKKISKDTEYTYSNNKNILVIKF